MSPHNTQPEAGSHAPRLVMQPPLARYLTDALAGEIIPQAVCSRHGLAVGAHAAWFVQALMYLCAVIAYPISLLLDWILGHEHAVRRGQLPGAVHQPSSCQFAGAKPSLAVPSCALCSGITGHAAIKPALCSAASVKTRLPDATSSSIPPLHFFGELALP